MFDKKSNIKWSKIMSYLDIQKYIVNTQLSFYLLPKLLVKLIYNFTVDSLIGECAGKVWPDKH